MRAVRTPTSASVSILIRNRIIALFGGPLLRREVAHLRCLSHAGSP